MSYEQTHPGCIRVVAQENTRIAEQANEPKRRETFANLALLWAIMAVDTVATTRPVRELCGRSCAAAGGSGLSDAAPELPLIVGCRLFAFSAAFMVRLGPALAGLFRARWAEPRTLREWVYSRAGSRFVSRDARSPLRCATDDAARR